MPEFNVMCIDAEEARDLVHKNVNGYEVISEAVSEWEIEEVQLAWVTQKTRLL